MKKLAIYFSDPEPMGYPFNSKYPYWEIYQDIIGQIEEHDIEVYVVRGVSYLGKGVFSHGWRVKNKHLVLVPSPITVDLIFNRDDKNTIPAIYDCPIINHPNLDRLCVDKVATAEFFPEYSPKTKRVDSFDEYVATAKEWMLQANDKVVLKKNFLTEGRGVHIISTSEVVKELYETWRDVLVQEFIDSSLGIPGIIRGLHDIRVTTISGTPAYTFVRVPPEGSFIANIARGGTEIPLTLDRIPRELLEIVGDVHKKLERYNPSIVASDFVNSRNGFKLIEMNSRPGVCDPDLSEQDRRFNEMIVEMLVSILTPFTS